MKRYVSIILALVLAFGVVPSAFAESVSAGSQNTKKSVEYDSRFAETFIAEIEGKSGGSGTGGIPGFDQIPDLSVPYSDRWFTDSSFNFNPHLATLSSTVMLTSFNYERKEGAAVGNGTDATGLLNECGFSDVQSNKYYFLPTEEHSVGCVAGHKTIQADGKEYTLLAVIPASPGYGQEWVGNFTVGNGSMHQGFKAARDEALRFLRNYMVEHKIKGDLKVWISGHSRFAAVANMIGGFFAGGGAGYFDGVTVDPENVFCFSFAPPMTIKADKALKKEALSVEGYRGEEDPRYENDSAGEPYVYNGIDANDLVKPHDDVFNGIRSCTPGHDLVPQLPPEKWGLDRYGVDLPLTDGSAATKAKMEEIMKELYPTYYEMYVKGDEDNYTWKTIDFKKAAIVDDTSCKDPISQAWMFADRVNNGLARRADSTDTYVDGEYEKTLCALAGVIGMDAKDLATGVTKDRTAIVKAGVFSYLSYAVERLGAERGYSEDKAIAVAVEELLELIMGRKINEGSFTFDDFIESFAKLMAEDTKYTKVTVKDAYGDDAEVYDDLRFQSKTAELIFGMLVSALQNAISEDTSGMLPALVTAYHTDEDPDSEHNKRVEASFIFSFMKGSAYGYDGDQDNPENDEDVYSFRKALYAMMEFVFGRTEGMSDLLDAMGRNQYDSIDGSGKFSDFIKELMKILLGKHEHVADAADEALEKLFGDGVQAALDSGTFAEGSIRYQEFQEHGEVLLSHITIVRELLLDLLFYDVDSDGNALPFNTERNLRYATTFMAQAMNIAVAHLSTAYDSWMRAQYTVDTTRKEVIALLKVIGEENADQAIDKDKFELIVMRQINLVRDAETIDEVEELFADAKDKIRNYIEVEQVEEAKERAQETEQIIQDAIRQAVEEAEKVRKAAEEMAAADEAVADAMAAAEAAKAAADKAAANEYSSDSDKAAINSAKETVDNMVDAASALPAAATAAQKNEAAKAIEDAVKALNDAADAASINSAAAKAEVDDAANAAKQLTAAKAAAADRLDDYSEAKALADATEDEKAPYDKAVADGRAAISAAEDKDAVAAALTSAKRAVDAVLVEIESDRAAKEKIAKAKTIKVTIKKAKAITKKKAKVTWKKVSGAAGYQVTYSTSKKFSKNTKTVNAGAKASKKTLKKLQAGKKYYVKVRVYKVLYNPETGADEKVYGKWSKVKSLRG